MKRLNRIIPGAATAIIALAFTSISLHANPVTVEELGIGLNETVYISSTGLGNNLHVYAGLINLKVDGVATTGFCIDPWHWSLSGPLSYETRNLDLAPKPPGPMGTDAATKIEQLWAQYYNSALSSKIVASALQLEIWKLVDFAVSSSTFALISIDQDSALVTAKTTEMTDFLLANPNAPTADLIALTGSGQDYVVQRPVPDGGSTLMLLGFGMSGLAMVRSRFKSRA